MGKYEGTKSLGRPRSTREDNIKVHLVNKCDVERRMGLSGRGSGQMTGSCEHGNVCLGSINSGEFLE